VLRRCHGDEHRNNFVMGGEMTRAAACDALEHHGDAGQASHAEWPWWSRGLVALSIALVATLGSCAQPASPGPLGHLVGVMSMTSGLQPTPQPPANGSVTVTPPGYASGQEWTTTPGSDGSYSFDLPPGTYWVIAYWPSRSVPKEVTITAGETVRLDLQLEGP